MIKFVLRKAFHYLENKIIEEKIEININNEMGEKESLKKKIINYYFGA